MDETSSIDGDRPTVEWRLLPGDSVSSPITCTVPYLELKLEHPGLEPDSHGDRFFPDVVPYEPAGTPRVFYWRPALGAPGSESRGWELACATTHELIGIGSLPAAGPSLVTAGATARTLVVDGTIGGDTTVAHVASYAEPNVAIDAVSDSGVELTVDGTAFQVSTGERRRIPLPERHVEPAGGADEPTTVEPELVVRYPGRRELHHPAPGATYRLFPSFGLDLGAVPNPLSPPTAAGELDHDALASELDVDLSQRPYPEGVLWQAFAYTAFDPHGDTTPELTQLDTGHLVVRTGTFEVE